MINYTNVAATAFNMPKLGLGTLSISSAEVKPIINEALSLGYRLFDCAPVYFNVEIGDAFHESTSNVPRTDVFITSKLASPFHRPEHVEVRCIMHYKFPSMLPTYVFVGIQSYSLQ